MALRMELDDPNPGWYVVAGGDATLIPRTQVSISAAESIAGAFEWVISQIQDEENRILPVQIVQSGNNLIRTELQRQVQLAEESAQRLPQLRQQLNALIQEES